MSRRKQENPQPRKRLINAEAELLQDTLTCGSCQKVFVLSEIVKFIQHKVHSCNKENSFIILQDGAPDPDYDTDRGPLAPVGKPPSISAPICNRKGLHHQHLHLHRANRLRASALSVAEKAGLEKACDKVPSPPGSQRFGQLDSGLPNNTDFRDDVPKFFMDSRKEYEEKKRLLPKEELVVKQELKDTALRTSPKILVNAYTNTIITEPSTYTCSTCKQTFTSAWVLVQHAQHMHGMKIYLVTSYHGNSGRNSNNSSSVPPPSLINNSNCVGIPLPPVLPPCTMNGSTHHHAHHHHHHGVLPQQALALENHPALQLLRMPLGERQFTPSSLNAPHSFFARPSSQDFRVDMLATSSSVSGGGGNGDSSQFHRLNHQSHSAPNALSANLGIGGFDTQHNPFLDSRAPTLARPPPMSLSFEPQIDFYSQKLRQLAGTTSPTTTMTSSPRKLTPPSFPSQPPMSSSSQPSTPTSTPQPVLNLHSSGGGGSGSGGNGNITPASTNSVPLLNNTHMAHQGSSASSTSSKGGGVTDIQEGGGDSPELSKIWPCEFCGKTFRFQSNLTVHRRSHTGEKPYKCPICRHSCSQASKLKRHMKTHQSNNNGKPGSEENNSMESPRSTPDSTTETSTKGNGRKRRPSLDDDDDGSDGQTADNEEEEEEDLDDEDELEEEEELDDEDDLDDSNEVMMAEDLSTRGPTSSTPIPRSSPSDPVKSKNNDVTNNDNNSNTISVSNGDNESSRPDQRHSLLSEVMDKIGLSNIQHYSEAYQKALEESSLKNSLKDSHGHKPVTENGNGTERPNRDEGNKMTNSHCKSAHSMDFGHGFFGAFDYHHHNAFQASKRLKLDIADHIRGGNSDRDSLYAGLWLPSVHNNRDLFAGVVNHSGETGHNKSSSSESALKSVTPTNMSSRSLSPRPGTSGGGSSATPGSLLMGSSNGSKGSSKEQRRNDTCEYCGKVFKNCSNLTVHRRSHTGEKPYKCELCSYACAQSSKLTRHMKTHGRLGKDVYRCRFCDMPFSVPSTLEKHMRKCVVNQNASGVSYLDRDSDSKELT